mmetsp:Transcript_28012/g.63443  ORF Transcript_28012/g.63443 Transcript_28012/m.63443 type:complete len:305 (-) Transcript_28012:178-1092(-)
MKLQTKKGLLECFQDDPWRADFEKQAFASCQHPFIVNLDYAFQTDSLAIMVLGLATAGDLQKALNKSAEERLSEDRVRFYVAEMVLALSYLHQMGLMYRDLKPNNVLLNDDGHIQLVDLGGVADESGSTLGKKQEAQGLIPLFTQHFVKKTGNYANSAGHHLATVEEKDKDEAELEREKEERELMAKGGNAVQKTGYMSPEEEKAEEKALERKQALEKGVPAPTVSASTKKAKEGGLEVLLEETPYARVRIRRCNMGPKTVLKVESEDILLKALTMGLNQLEADYRIMLGRDFSLWETPNLSEP